MAQITPILPSDTAQGSISVLLKTDELDVAHWKPLAATISRKTEVKCVAVVIDGHDRGHLEITTNCGHLRGPRLLKTFNTVVQWVTRAVDHKIEQVQKDLVGADA